MLIKKIEKKEELGGKKPQLESNHMNKATYRPKYEDVKKSHQNHTMWGRKVRKYRFVLL